MIFPALILFGGFLVVVGAVALRRTLVERRALRRAERLIAEVLRSRSESLRSSQSGQSIVEVALALPVLVAILLAIFTGGKALGDRSLVANAARSAAVAAATGGDAQAAAQQAAPGVDGLSVSVDQTGSVYTACVSAPWSIEWLLGQSGGTLRACSSETNPGGST